MNNIMRGFKKLLYFTGRDSRAEFWPYAGVVFATAMLIAVVIFVPYTMNQFSEMTAFAEANPDQATVQRSATSVTVQIHDTTGMPPMDMLALGMPMAVLLIFVVMLLASAVTRRLHDRGIAGFWALIPAGLYAVGLILWMRMMSSMFSDATAMDDGAFMVAFMINFLGLMLAQLSTVALLIVLSIKGKTGPNRYGPEPV